MGFPTVEATFSSRCSVCDETIHEGDTIVMLEDDEEWVHEGCADG